MVQDRNGGRETSTDLPAFAKGNTGRKKQKLMRLGSFRGWAATGVGGSRDPSQRILFPSGLTFGTMLMYLVFKATHTHTHTLGSLEQNTPTPLYFKRTKPHTQGRK